MNDINKMKDLVKLYLGLDLYAYKEVQLNTLLINIRLKMFLNIVFLFKLTIKKEKDSLVMLL